MKSINLLYGRPGAGKSYIMDGLKDVVSYISLGAIARSEIESKSELGIEIKHDIETAKHYSSDVLRSLGSLVISAAYDSGNPCIIDGYPKYKDEIPYVLPMMQNYSKLGRLFVLNTPKDVAINRITNRFICTSCGWQGSINDSNSYCIGCNNIVTKRSEDASRESVNRRMEVYCKYTKPTIGLLLSTTNFQYSRLQWDANIEELKNKILNEVT